MSLLAGTSPGPKNGWRLPRSLRLRRSSDFRTVQRGGRRFHVAHLVVVHHPNGAELPRFGLAVSRKVGNAVVRNQVKRWLREAIRHERAGLQGLDVVFIARSSAAGAGASSLRASVRKAIRRIHREA